MAPLKPVKSLFDFSLNEALNVIHGYTDIYQNELTHVRTHLIGMLHGGIREQLINRAISSLPVHEVLKILKILADSTTKKLHFSKDGELLSGVYSKALFPIINDLNIIGLHEFHVKVQMEEVNNYRVEDPYSFILQKPLKRGLASHLRVLTLYNAADNKILKIIGQHALHLTHLDITSSWLVDDVGIGDLLLNDASEIIKAHGGTEICEPGTIEVLAAFPKSQLNKTCETLQEVRIQDTNTTSISVLLLLMFSANLKSLGGFLYDKNIGDAVLSVQMRQGAPPHLPLTELWDTSLPMEKLKLISTYLPKLSSLYTRAAWLPTEPGILPSLTSLTADFDFGHYGPVLYPYLAFSGNSIRKLTLIDQVYRLDISQIGQHCPNLEDLTAKVTIEDEGNRVELKHLINAKVRITDPSTFTWIMRHAPNIQKFESLYEWKEDQDLFENGVILRLIDENPRSLKSIRRLSVYNNSCFLSSGTPTIEAAYALCEACDNLQVLGDLHTWVNVSKEDIQKINDHIRKNNWDITITWCPPHHRILF